MRLLYVFVVFSISSGALAQNTNNVATAEGAKTIRPIKVFILSGQSNAVGYNDHRQYRHGKLTLAEAFMNQPDILFWDASKRSWTTLRVGGSGGSTPHAFGPEIGFSHDMAKLLPNEQVAIVKCAAGGTGIARSRDYNDYIHSLKGFDDKDRNWHPPADGSAAGNLYQQLVKTVQDALAALERDGLNYEVSAFLWMQGEHEAGISARMADDYAMLLKSLMRSIRTDLKTPKLPFAVGEVNSHAWAYGEIVRKAQAEVCKEDSNSLLVKTTDLSRKGSGGAAHFDADGMIELGARFAKTVDQLLSRNKKNGEPSPSRNGVSAAHEE